MIVVAHAGHWLLQVLYAAPLFVMVVMLVVGRLRQQREAKRLEHSSPGPSSPARDHDHEEERDGEGDHHDRH